MKVMKRMTVLLLILALGVWVSCDKQYSPTQSGVVAEAFPLFKMNEFVIDNTPPDVSCSATPVDDDDDELQINFSATDDVGIATLTAVIDIGCEQIPVEDGQIVKVKCGDDDCEAEFDDDGTLEVKSNTATLIVTATDEADNTATCEIDLCPAEEEDDGDNDDNGDGDDNGDEDEEDEDQVDPPA